MNSSPRYVTIYAIHSYAKPTTGTVQWPYVPAEGWTAADLDNISHDGPYGELDALKHIELVNGELIVMSPQPEFHRRVVERLCFALGQQCPARFAATREMDIVLGSRQRPCPDVSVVTASAAADVDRTFYVPDEVSLVVEVVSKSSQIRDRETKPRLYARAGIQYFWRVERNDDRLVIYCYELDPANSNYALRGIFHDQLSVIVPFETTIQLDSLLR